MQASQKKNLKAKGWKIGSAADFLNLSLSEREEVNLSLKKSPKKSEALSVSKTKESNEPFNKQRKPD